jgi:hypothetical protein
VADYIDKMRASAGDNSSELHFDMHGSIVPNAGAAAAAVAATDKLVTSYQKPEMKFTNVYVKNIPESLASDDLKAIFPHPEKILSCIIMTKVSLASSHTMQSTHTHTKQNKRTSRRETRSWPSPKALGSCRMNMPRTHAKR